jgi:hypothetical protein
MIKKYTDIEGWCDFEDLYLEYANQLNESSTFVEVGVWKGRSICFLGQALKALNKSPKIFAIDTFKGSDNEPIHKDAIDKCGGDTLSIFRDNLKDLNLSDSISIMQEESIEASKQFSDNSIDIIFIDSNHSYESVTRDLNAWYSKVKVGGIISGHDFLWKSVENAVREFSEKEKIELIRKSYSCWFMYKK